MSETAEAIFNRVAEILDGIDREDGDDGGWWETSFGARFGAERLAAIRALLEG